VRTAHGIRLGIGLLLVLLLATSLAGVGLMVRISPTVEGILRENVVSFAAAERMLAALATGDEPEFEAALGIARGNVTERQEEDVLRWIERRRRAAFEGGAADTEEVAAALLDLGRINRAAIERAGTTAERLGFAGAWVMVLLGLAGFGASYAIVLRIERQVLGPLGEIVAVLRAAAGGDPLRRCGPARGAVELRETSREVDRLLDERMRLRGGAEVTRETRTRTALRALLDRMDDPVAVVDPEGELLAASEAVRERLLGRDAEAWREALRAGDGARVRAREPLPEGAGWLVRLGEGT